jgi:hypothetical protein
MENIMSNMWIIPDLESLNLGTPYENDTEIE